MTIAGIDLSTKAVDVVLLEEDSDRAEWHRITLTGHDAFERARAVRGAMTSSYLSPSFWDDVVAVGIEDPRGYGAGSLYRVQGAILACIPSHKLVQPWIPSAWRKACGLPGNCPKSEVAKFAWSQINWQPAGLIHHSGGVAVTPIWEQDGLDAYCIAYATRQALEHTVAA